MARRPGRNCPKKPRGLLATAGCMREFQLVQATGSGCLGLQQRAILECLWILGLGWWLWGRLPVRRKGVLLPTHDEARTHPGA